MRFLLRKIPYSDSASQNELVHGQNKCIHPQSSENEVYNEITSGFRPGNSSKRTARVFCYISNTVQEPKKSIVKIG